MRMRLLAVALLVPILGACATKRDLQDLQSEMARMQETLLRELQRQNAVLMDSLTAQDVRMRGDFMNQMIRLERNLVQIQELTGQSQQALAEFRQSLQVREEALSRTTIGDPAIAGDPNELFQSAEGALQRGSLATARVAFEEFVNAFPDHERAPAARLYLGNILSAEGEVQRALEEYSAILSLYPNSTEAPTALFHAALVERDRGNRNAAETMLNQLTAAYPSSPEAGAARDELRRMR
jgi:tol-pal system protein YbgF